MAPLISKPADDFQPRRSKPLVELNSKLISVLSGSEKILAFDCPSCPKIAACRIIVGVGKWVREVEGLTVPGVVMNRRMGQCHFAGRLKDGLVLW